MNCAIGLSLNHRLDPRSKHFNLTAMEVAYAECDPWLHKMLTYLEGNRNFLMTNLGELKSIKVTEPEGTYFLWMDFRETGRNHPSKDLLLKV